jgi:CMD domain protein
MDVIADLAGIEPGSPLAAIRERRLQARENAQASYAALFEPADTSAMSLAERLAVATFVASLHRQAETRDFYAAKLLEADAGLARAVAAEAAHGATHGPYGAYPKGPLSTEDKAGPHYIPADAGALGPRLAAAFVHVHLLVFRPRDSNAAALQALLDAGWSTDGVVTLSQLVAFLAFQIRSVAGLRILAATPAA